MKKPRARTAKKTPAAPVAPPTADEEKATTRFVRDVLTRGEAVEPDEEGKLPPGATHEIVRAPDEDSAVAEGLPAIRRRRFSAY